ncbi:hypothetical protein D6D20_06439 [Aureobasidium pullulans]|uniref:SURP motif domain-containing protein n=2 Tax=Aureobasidium pullulans TaxID=5580 RepID=A0A4S8Z3D9_AURPU|nr:hypothetical protein D6D20_06439 [Aureobasidium pullulans]
MSVGGPHDLLELPEFAEEARVAVVDLLCILLELRVFVALNVPDTVGLSASLCASYLLLFEAPVGKLDLVREQNTASHDVNELELGLNGTDTVLGHLTVGQVLDDLNLEKIVCISLEAFITVCRNLVLPVSVGHWGTVVVRVDAAVSDDVVELEDGAIFDQGRFDAVPCPRGRNVGTVNVDGLSLVLEEPNVVLILMGVESDLLLLAASGVHVAVRVQVASLSVVMTDRDTAAESDICGNVLHTLAVESRLELGRHETIAVTRVDEAEEVDGEHAHARSNGLGVTEKNPELENSKTADPSNGEETDPLDTDSGSKAETAESQPEPPARCKGLRGTLLVLVGERSPTENGQGGKDDQGRIEQNKDGKDTHEGREKAHGNVWDTRFDVVLADVFEVELAIEAGQPASEGDEELGQWGVDVHEELALDVLGSETTEAVETWGKRVAGDILDLVKDDTGGLRDAKQAHEEGDDRKGTADQPIVGLESRDIVVLDTFGCEAVGLRHRLGVGLTSRGFGGTVGHGYNYPASLDLPHIYSINTARDVSKPLTMAPAPLLEPNDTPDNTDFKPPPGVILPPKEFRTLLEKTAGYIVRNGPAFEARIRDSAENNPKLQFVLPDNPYHPFYLWRLEEIKEGRGTDVAAGREGDVAAPKKKQGPAAPPDFHFSARMPNISSVDLEVIKLTAIFVAKNGRTWMTTLSQREARNPQFDFLRPQHSFYQFFSRLVDQYTEILNTQGQQQQEVVAELEKNVDNKYRVLDSAKKRAEWVKFQEAQKVKKEEEHEAEKLAYAQIDWHDFVVVETILFTEADDQTELPPPTSLNDIQSASLEQKAQMSLAPSGMRIEEAMPGQETYYQPPPSQMPPPSSYSPAPPAFSPAQQTGFAPPPRTPQEQEEDARIAERTAERQRAEQAQAAARGQGPMRIRNDYVPRAQARRQNAATALCPNCKQQIPFNELEQHMKIEMLDPRWREQSRIAAQRSSTTNLSTADVANNLKRLASQRSDVFDPVTGQAVSDEEAQRRKRIELSSYDGVNPSQSGPPGASGNQPPDVQEQVMTPTETTQISG